MSRKYKFRDSDKLYFVSFAVVYWIDLFIRDEYKKVVLDSWQYCMANKGMELYGWCIMTSHIHIIIGSHGDKLEKIMQNMKRHTSEMLHKTIKNHKGESRKEWMLPLLEKFGTQNKNNKGFQFWQQHNKPIEIWSQEVFDQKLSYIHYNPVASGFVGQPEHWLFSSARNYAKMPAPIQIVYG